VLQVRLEQLVLLLQVLQVLQERLLLERQVLPWLVLLSLVQLEQEEQLRSFPPLRS
jgi:hypothetical protein